jgi:hypothetical protein
MAAWNRASALSFQEQEPNSNSGFLDRTQAVRWTLAICRGFGGRLLLCTRSGDAYASTSVLLAALAYFIFRWRYRPLTLLWRGLAFTDDAAVLTALFGLTAHIKLVHRAAAARALGRDITRTEE